MWQRLKSWWYWVWKERKDAGDYDVNIPLVEALREEKQELDLAEDERKDVIEETLKRR